MDFCLCGGAEADDSDEEKKGDERHHELGPGMMAANAVLGEAFEREVQRHLQERKFITFANMLGRKTRGASSRAQFKEMPDDAIVAIGTLPSWLRFWWHHRRDLSGAPWPGLGHHLLIAFRGKCAEQTSSSSRDHYWRFYEALVPISFAG